ncbi:metallophosphoesterase family protein [Desulfomicrobium orale]|uniref:Calcineurin-like phosphoesterase domain-containing protein n=1 Tax=Desulfomicrobium orale DSM 12838 TaxID=888061 RepID=A0A109W6L4_9BACT|nr:metallophosphoesterase [Desulfomicrobium orale]AMD93800.1 hypothetical protein AXF15_12275 [Desulfomicrobium orale DSM 12838]
MTTLLHLSDTHFGTEVRSVAQALKRLAREEGVNALVLSGDITQRATRRQFMAAREYVQALAVPHVLALPGNHDISLWCPWQRLIRPHSLYQEFFPTPFDRHGLTSLVCPGVTVIGVNTTRPHRHIHGELSSDQIAGVARRLTAAPQTLKLVAVHQPAHVLHATERRNLLRGNMEAALQAWLDAGADAVLGGHIHHPYIVPVSGNGQGQRLWIIQAGTAVSRRVRENYPNSVNLIRRTSGGTAWQAQRWDYSASAQRFEMKEQICIQEVSHP